MKVDNYIVQDDRVKPVPYAVDLRADSIGYGFVDLKANPDLVVDIVEARGLPNLQRLLTLFASSASPFYSIGCENAVWQQEDNRFAARGYIEFAFNFPTLAHFPNYEALQTGFTKHLTKAEISGLRYFEWQISPIDVISIKMRLSSCTIWISLSDQPSKELALKRYDKSVGLLASYFYLLDIPHSASDQIFGSDHPSPPV